jgi:hypothetical protein
MRWDGIHERCTVQCTIYKFVPHLYITLEYDSRQWKHCLLDRDFRRIVIVSLTCAVLSVQISELKRSTDFISILCILLVCCEFEFIETSVLSSHKKETSILAILKTNQPNRLFVFLMQLSERLSMCKI